LALNYNLTSAISRNFYDVSFAKLYDVNLAPNNWFVLRRQLDPTSGRNLAVF